MKITQIVPVSYPSYHYGGASEVVHQLSKQFNINGHQSITISTNAYKPKEVFKKEREIIDNEIICRCKNLSNRLSFKRKLFLPINLSKFSNIIENSDIIHIHDLRTMLTLWGIKLAKKYNKPVIIQPHGAVNKSTKYLVKSIFDKLLKKRLKNTNYYLIALNKDEYSKWKRIFGNPKDKLIIGNGISTDIIKKPQAINSSKLNVLYLGRIHTSKRLDLLIDAARILSQKKEKRITFTIAGISDDMQLNDSSKIPKNINYLGEVSERQKINLYQSSDVFFVPKFTGIPIGLLEAIANGCLGLTTMLSEKLDIKDNKIVSYIQPNKETIAKKLERLYYSKKELDTTRIYRYEFALNSLTWDKISKKYLDFYEQLIQKVN